MKRPCLDCGVLAETHRCPQHLAIWQQTQEQYRTRRRASTAERGYNGAWRRLRAAHLLTYPACVVCGTTQDVTVDHIIPLVRGGQSTPTNLQTLCRKHNSSKGAR